MFYIENYKTNFLQIFLLGDFQLNLGQSSFVDWQRLRVQENADEIPPGRDNIHTYVPIYLSVH